MIEANKLTTRAGTHRSRKLKQSNDTPTFYPAPSILMVAGGRSPQTIELKQRLENRGCHVYQFDTDSEHLGRTIENYFDIILINLEQPAGDDFEIFEKLKVTPELINIPIILMSNEATRANRPKFDPGPVYWLTRDCSEAMLLQIIAQIHYLTYRYV
jgi:CheY-like chemotaxis protein